MNVFENSMVRRSALAAFAGCLVMGMAGCNGCNSANTAAPLTSAQNTDGGQDPAMANLSGDSYNAPPPTGGGQPTRVLGSSSSYPGTQQGEYYPEDQQYAVTDYDQDSYGQQPMYSDQAPPPLPEYDQPPAPAQNDIWTPGYWAYGTGGYYWVPGAWVAAPYYGALWTPPYWGFSRHHYYFHHGYWGPHVGFYGGINYGFGYIGTGFWGGYWQGHDFYYNRAVTRVGGIRNVYDRPVVYNNVTYGVQPMVRTAFNGGPGGINRSPERFETAAMHEHHEGPLAVQTEIHRTAAQNRAQFFTNNQGRPAEVVASHAFGNPGSIRATPENVHPGREGFHGQPAAVREQQNHEQQNHEEQLREQPGAMNRPGRPGGQGGLRPEAGPNAPAQMHDNHVTPQMQHQQGPPQMREATQQQHQLQAPQMREAPQQHQQGPPQMRETPQQQHQQGPPQMREAPQQQHQQGPPQMREAPQQQHQQQAPQMREAPQQHQQGPPQMREAPQQQHQQQTPQVREAPKQHQQGPPQMREAPQQQHQQQAPQMREAPQQHEAPHPAPAPQAAPPAAAPHPGPPGGDGGHPGGGNGHHH